MVKTFNKRLLATTAIVAFGMAATASAETLEEVMTRRGLSQTDMMAAAKNLYPHGRPR